jgi:hypothetical protein
VLCTEWDHARPIQFGQRLNEIGEAAPKRLQEQHQILWKTLVVQIAHRNHQNVKREKLRECALREALACELN